MRRIGRLLASVAVATAALAGVDLLVHVELPIRLATGTSAVRASDLAGLLLADAEAGVLATGLAALLARVGRSAAPPLLATLVGGALLAVGVRERWSMAGWLVPAAVAWPIAAALAAVTARTLRRARASAAVAAAAPVLWVGLAATIGNVAIAHVAHGASLRGAVEGAAALGALGLLAWPPAWRRGATARVLCWSPALAALALAVVAAMPVPAPAPAGTPRRGGPPDLVLVVLDTVRADRLGTYGHARDTMPALDRWARRGRVLGRAVSPGTWTAPSHASLFTGLMPSEHGVHAPPRVRAHEGLPWTRARPGLAWLPAQLAAMGYDTVAVSANPMAIGFGVDGFATVRRFRREAWRDGTVAATWNRAVPWLDAPSARLRWRLPYADAERVVDVAIAAAPRGPAPAFLFVNLMDAHAPYVPTAAARAALGVDPPSYWEPYAQGDDIEQAVRIHGEAARRAAGDLYDAELRGMDGPLGRLLAWVEAAYGPDALVVVTSDHGEELGEAGRVGHHQGPLQTLVHVPLIVRGGGIEPGRTDRLVSTRTLFDLLLAAARGEVVDAAALAAPTTRDVLAERYHARPAAPGAPWRSRVALFDGRYKAVGPSDGGLELYDLEARGFDAEVPTEAAAARRLAARVDVYWAAHRDPRDAAPDIPSSREARRWRPTGDLDYARIRE